MIVLAMFLFMVCALAFQKPVVQRLGQNRRFGNLNMHIYSSSKGVPAALVEERDACGVGFIASLSNEPSHHVVAQALTALSCMEHRGANSADNVSGDGSGIMSAIPWDLFAHICDPNFRSNRDGSTSVAVGMIFLPRDDDHALEATKLVESAMDEADFDVIGWRDVPVNLQVLGSLSADYVPKIRQVVVASKAGKEPPTAKSFNQALYDVRRVIQGKFRKNKYGEAYVCSLSSKTIVYKGMLRSCDLAAFYKDLVDERYRSPFAIYHRRFSTNTVPKWFLAQPMRVLAHNGEINTLLGNINWVKSRQFAGRVERAAKGEEDNRKRVKGPLVDVAKSDSANLDSILDNYVQRGERTPQEALMILVPEAYYSNPRLQTSPDVLGFYEFYESLQEAWDGPALLVFSDGDNVGAALDRNGLRPARYMVTADKDGKETVHVMSEVGVTKALAQFADAGSDAASNTNGPVVVDSGRLGPGEMLTVDLVGGRLLLNDQVKQEVASKRPYKQWLDQSVAVLPRSPFVTEMESFVDKFVRDSNAKAIGLAAAHRKGDVDTLPVATEVDAKDLVETQTFFGWGTEDVEMQILSMAAEGIEATFCMGDDAPLAALSGLPHTLYDYFKQRFAQVTNPPIDSLREGAVMALTMYLGPREDPRSTTAPTGRRVKIESPILNGAEVSHIASLDGVKLVSLSTIYPLKQALTQGGLEEKIDELCQQAVAAVQAGATIIDLSDKAPADHYPHNTYVSPLLAVGAVHHKLIQMGLRTKVSIIVTTGQAWSTHHFACLVGFGASAVVPYAAFDAVLNWHGQKRIQLAIERGEYAKVTAAKALTNYRKAADKGLLKILSKMGISLLTSYHGAQIFEALGLADDVINKAFKGTPCRVSGLTFDNIAAEGAEFARKAYGDDIFTGMVQKVEETAEGELKAKKLFNYGFLNFLKSGEYHHNNQPLIKTLHTAIRTHNLDLYNLYEQSVTSRPPTTLRDVLQFVPAEVSGRKPIPLESVESAESIMKRFCSGGMSLGALSREAHETMAISMNRIGGKSNSGEGGEDPIRFIPITDVDEKGTSKVFPHLKGLRNGDVATSRIKQVASGRFGVTPEYLMSGDQLEIKVAQGAKPGEGGQLPGAKIDDYIATLRKSKPGVTLISPPPHHDIYSIEDLAQLIYDLHQINPAAGVSVKLVSEVGIGTVASGVAKAGADIIQISGHDGGTGASPVTSIKHAGSPWELGLIESHSTLLRNGLRERVLLRVDGGLKSGWDVVMAAAMGAEEFGFGTIAMIAEGCIMARICHTNKCPVGVTTQNEELRKRFPGTPDNVVTFFGYVAEEVRHILAELGFASLDDMIGREGLLQARQGLQLKKVSSVDVSYLLENLDCPPVNGENLCPVEPDRSWLKHGPVFSNGFTFDDAILADAEVESAIAEHKAVSRSYRITNTDRSAFARVSGSIAKRYGDAGFQGSLRFALTGAAGQSFCAFLGRGMDVALTGYANDYVSKGMAGGIVVVSPPMQDDAATRASGRVAGAARHSVVGNTVLYGATGGKLLVRGRGGERFAVRNSGALGVVEGLGDHGCEYMTAGTIVCLGNTGRNFGAGMTGGLAFVLNDEAWLDGVAAETSDVPFENLVNRETVTLWKLGSTNSVAREALRTILEEHVDRTGSLRAKHVLDNLDVALEKFSVVVPNSEKNNPLLAVTEMPSQSSVSM